MLLLSQKKHTCNISMLVATRGPTGVDKSQSYDPIPSFPYGPYVLLLDKAIPLFYRVLGVEDDQVGPVAWYKSNVQRTLLEGSFEKLDFEVGSFLSVTFWYIWSQKCQGVTWRSNPLEHHWMRNLSSDQMV